MGNADGSPHVAVVSVKIQSSSGHQRKNKISRVIVVRELEFAGGTCNGTT